MGVVADVVKGVRNVTSSTALVVRTNLRASKETFVHYIFIIIEIHL